MKMLQTILTVTLCGAIFAVAASASAQPTQNGYATVVRVQGGASYSLGDGVTHALVAGKLLPAGATIYTSDSGVVDVVLGKKVVFPQSSGAPDRISAAPDAPVRGLTSIQPATQQNVVRLTPNSTLVIDKLTTTDTGADTVSDTELDLQKGKIYASVKKLSATSQYLVKIPNGVAGVRGTKFSISADGSTAVFETSSSGLVITLSGPNGTQSYTIAAGQMLDPVSGVVSIPADAQSNLGNLFSALATTYKMTFSYDKSNNVFTFVSPTTGDQGGSAPLPPI